jgi:hypothetical protein
MRPVPCRKLPNVGPEILKHLLAEADELKAPIVKK